MLYLKSRTSTLGSPQPMKIYPKSYTLKKKKKTKKKGQLF